MAFEDDDPAAVERAMTWLYSESSPDAVGDNRSPVAAAVAAVLREVEGLSASSIGLLLAEHWNLFACDPPLSQREIEQAVRRAFSPPPRHEPAAPATPPETPPQRAVVTERSDLQIAPRKAPLTVAERSRRYRQRRKARRLAAGDAAARGTAMWFWEVPA